MQSFISSVINHLLKKGNDLINYKIILPNKRAGVFFKDELKKQLKSLIFLPEILSIEEFIQEISKIELLSSLEIIFEFYQIYLKNTPKNKIVDFKQFSNWSSILIQDINELDRHLIEVNYFFNYLADIHRIEKWFLNNEEKTTLTKNYLNFFNSFAIYYKEFYNYLIQQKKGYKGLQYREAVKKIDTYISYNTTKKMVFVGFNALNKAEESIIQKILENNIGEIFFDVDQFFIEKKLPYANFIKQYKTKWNYYNTNKFNTINNDFIKEKLIHIIGVPKNVSMIKEVGLLLKKMKPTLKNYQNTALVLANENLLTTTLNSLPKEVENVNITMGYPLKNIGLSSLFSHLFKLHQNKTKLGNDKSYYYKDIISVLSNVNLSNYFKVNNIPVNELIIKKILKNNYSFIDKSKLLTLVEKEKNSTKIINLLFSNWKDIEQAITNCIELIKILHLEDYNNLNTEYLKRFNNLFQQLKNLNLKYGYITNLTCLRVVFDQLLNTENLSFKGEPLSGLQIMGMLETRVLDFETVIITSVNEGFIPSGKTNNSFIPFDVKREFGIPTYNEKDAIFSYHFYRLIQRAKNIYLLYNTETDDFGSGEQSRFITQLEIFNTELPNHTIYKSIVSPKLHDTTKKLIQINKSVAIIEILKELANKGLSPTALTNYIYNPIAFYKNKILKIKTTEEIEETIAANTFGTIIHNTLEELYTPYINTFLTVDHLELMQKKAILIIKKYFKKVFRNGNITTGKNLLTFEISKHYLKTFLTQELSLIKSGKTLKILNLEVNLKTDITIKGINHPIRLIGQADRIDELDGVIRIIDYKTGKATQSDLNIKSWELITTNYRKYHKSFQVLMYAYMYAKINKLSFEDRQIESGIISFKNLKSGFLKVNKKPITTDAIQNFEIELKKLIVEIYNTEIPFLENEKLPF
ncbi:MAG: PD-(D/E)XK nuclease family protein [Flavobacteriaceae bacterium]|nr:PD-(D/E)XK nuclease family protein [Flavobacteriaceae bacterium]